MYWRMQVPDQMKKFSLKELRSFDPLLHLQIKLDDLVLYRSKTQETLFFILCRLIGLAEAPPSVSWNRIMVLVFKYVAVVARLVT